MVAELKRNRTGLVTANPLISIMMMVREPLAKGIDAPISTAMY
jgi:hypothetical protein